MSLKEYKLNPQDVKKRKIGDVDIKPGLRFPQQYDLSPRPTSQETIIIITDHKTTSRGRENRLPLSPFPVIIWPLKK